jgi:hypothetical protein
MPISGFWFAIRLFSPGPDPPIPTRIILYYEVEFASHGERIDFELIGYASRIVSGPA